MNTVLQAQNVEDQIDSILEVYEVFDANGLNAKDYQTLKKGTGFYWFKTVNKIVILDEETKNIIYPTDLENYTYEPGTLFSLSGEIAKDTDYVTEVGSDNKITKAIIENGNELFDLMDNIKNDKTKYSDSVTIQVANDIDLYGVSGLNFDAESKDIIIEGSSTARKVPTISGITNYKNDFISPDSGGIEWKYSYGLIPTVKNHNVTIRNVNFNALETVADPSKGLGVGLLIGQVYANSSVTIDNVNITNSTISGAQFIGGFIGRVIGLYAPNDTDTVKVEITNSSISDSTVSAFWGQNAGLIGSIVELGKYSESEKTDPNKAIQRIKDNVILTNTTLNNVSLPITGVETKEVEFTPNMIVSHCESTYHVKKSTKIVAGLADYGDHYQLLPTAKLFNINPTFKHDASKAEIENYNIDNKQVGLNCALFPIDQFEDLDNILITKLV